jgi:hypothetical protein
VPTNYSGSGSNVIGYDETTFNPVTALPVTGIGAVNTSTSGLSYQQDLVRWGQNGLPSTPRTSCIFCTAAT